MLQLRHLNLFETINNYVKKIKYYLEVHKLMKCKQVNNR